MLKVNGYYPYSKALRKVSRHSGAAAVKIQEPLVPDEDLEMSPFVHQATENIAGAVCEALLLTKRRCPVTFNAMAKLGAMAPTGNPRWPSNKAGTT